MVAVAHLSPAAARRLVVVRSAPPPSRPGVVVPPATYRRRRAVAAAALVTLVVAFCLAVQGLLGASGGGPRTVPEAPAAPASVYVVQSGDTFWGIAEMFRPDEDPRPIVTRLMAAHGSPVLRVGDRIPRPDRL